MTIKIPMYVGYFKEGEDGYYAQPLLFQDDDQAVELISKALEEAPEYDVEIYHIANFNPIKGEIVLCEKTMIERITKNEKTGIIEEGESEEIQESCELDKVNQ